MSYKKRAIGHWNQAKRYKGIRKAKERTFVTHEINEQIAEQDHNFKYRYKARHPNEIAKLEYRINWYERTIAEYERQKMQCSFVSDCRDSLRKTKQELKELKNVPVRS